MNTRYSCFYTYQWANRDICNIRLFKEPFEDGNKRTARLTANAILMSANHCSLSYRNVDNIEYKKGLLLFYEINNLTAFKKIFIEQYEFGVNNYF